MSRSIFVKCLLLILVVVNMCYGEESVSKETTKTLFQIQIGAFKSNETAINEAATWKEKQTLPIDIVKENDLYKLLLGNFAYYYDASTCLKHLKTDPIFQSSFIRSRIVSIFEWNSYGLDTNSDPVTENDAKYKYQNSSDDADSIWETSSTLWKQNKTLESLAAFRGFIAKYPEDKRSISAFKNIGYICSSLAYSENTADSPNNNRKIQFLSYSENYLKKYISNSDNVDLSETLVRLANVIYAKSRLQNNMIEGIEESIKYLNEAIYKGISNEDLLNDTLLKRCAYNLELARNGKVSYSSVLEESINTEKQMIKASDTVKARLVLIQSEAGIEQNSIDYSFAACKYLIENYKQLRSETAAAKFILGYIYYQNQHYAYAMPYLDSVLTEYDSKEDPMILDVQRQALLCKGICLFKSGNDPESVNLFKKVIELYPYTRESDVAQNYINQITK